MNEFVATDDNNTNKKRKLKHEEIKENKQNLYKAPTVEELNELRETEMLFNSNLFRLQSEELLKEVKIKEKRKREINIWMGKVESFFASLAQSSGVDITREIIKNDPLSLQTDGDELIKTIDFRVKNVAIVGLYNVLNATLSQTIKVVINVTMASECFQQKDYLNARYLVKRNLYLSWIATHLQNAKDLTASNITYTLLDGNNLTPMVCVTPTGVKNTIVHIFVSPEANTFKLSRFLPDKCNLRACYLKKLFNDEMNELQAPQSSSLIYNASICYDLTFSRNDIFRLNVMRDLPGARDGLILLLLWLRQLQLSSDDNYYCFSDELMYSVLVYLIHKKKVHKHMSSYQVIRNVWNYLAQSKWDMPDSAPPSLTDRPPDPKVTQLFHQHDDVVFMDRTGYYNIAANLNLNIYKKIQYESNLALSYLDSKQQSTKFHCFQILFMTKMPSYLQYDVVINIHNDELINMIYNSIEEKIRVNYFTLKDQLVVKHILEKLQKGLSDRIVHLIPNLKQNTVWNVGSKLSDMQRITFGLQLHLTNMFQIVDKGPPAYDPLAAHFRNFWAEKAELRRFKDGSICEAVYWPAESMFDKRRISKQIIEYLLNKQLKLKKYHIVYDQFDEMFNSSSKRITTAEESNLKIVNTFDELAKMLRDLNLPLSISAIQGISDHFCYTDPCPPNSSNYTSGKKVTYESKTNILFKENVDVKVCPKYIPSIQGIIQMVHHSKWPNDLTAMNKLRTAFYIQIADMLQQNANTIKCNPKTDYLDILYKGLIFRFELFHPKQIALMKKQVDETGLILYRDNEISIKMEQHYEIQPKIISALSGIQSQYPSYGPSTALIKRWLCSQFIDTFHMPNIIINLICASLYLNCAPFSAPVLPQTTFFRFLMLLSNQDWQLQSLVVNFNNELTSEQLDEIDANFQQKRDHYPVLCIMSPYDLKSLVSRYAPTAPILNRLRVLANKCLTIIENQIYTDTINTLVFFKPNLSGYNLIIHLQPLLNARRYQSMKVSDAVSEEEYRENLDDRIPILDFNPVELYLTDLRTNYDHFALFFHDCYGGNIIAVLWKQHIYQNNDFKISFADGKKLEEKTGKLAVNLDAIIEDFYILGGGIVKNIETM